MADTLTSHYGWVKPDPGGDANTWGVTLNATTDKIDAQVFTNQLGLVPVGSGMLWFTNTAPANWLICNGQSLSTSGTYAALFAVLGTTYNQSGDAAGTFRVPSMANVFPFGAGSTAALAATGGEVNHTLNWNEIPVHAHSITDVSHSHGAYQNAHTHGVYQDSHNHGDSGHGHGASASDSGHTHSYTASAAGPGSAGGTTFTATTGGTTGTGYANVSVSIGTGYANIDYRQPTIHIDTQQPGVGVNASGTGLSTTNNSGSGWGHNNMPPFMALNFIIKYQ